jgi:NTE family protein
MCRKSVESVGDLRYLYEPRLYGGSDMPVNPVDRSPPPHRVGLVLSGGGARGAYEAGILSYLFLDLPARLGRAVHFDIVTGTSVGGIHACYVAAGQQEPQTFARLLDIWRSLSLDRVFRVGAADLVRVPWQLLGFSVNRPLLPATHDLPQRLPGLFDTSWLESIVLENISWESIRGNIDAGRVRALALAATEIVTGRSVVFADTHTGSIPQWPHDPFVVARPTRLGPPHALASAAIPLLFPAIRIDHAYYCDGGLRLNTPLAPALRLGAEKVLVIGLRHPRTAEEQDRLARRREVNFSRPAYLVGKALNALLLDRIESDIDQLRLFNRILETGCRVYGSDFMARINEAIISERGAPYRIVPDFTLRPSKDLGELAAECLQERRARGLRDWLSRNVARYVGYGTLGEADLLSYLFFDRCYTEHLVALGRRDAEQASDALAQFLMA